MAKKIEIINDPIYGPVTIPSEFIYKIIEHPYFQRLRRIKQLSESSMVYPGALHTRFSHAIGCMYLMEQAVNILRIKGQHISDEEKEAVMVAILLHDIGHGPLSHSLENNIIKISHEKVSSIIMEKLNREFRGRLDLALQIFENKYPKKFLHQLISSQIDVDRIDYLKRDSYFTGVVEGMINADRLIAMLNVFNNELVLEQKAVYSVENFLISRRIMYWQTYYHKTVLSTENMVANIFWRVKTLAKNRKNISPSTALNYFLENDISEKNFDKKAQEKFLMLDDFDFDFSIKKWTEDPDEILSLLCQNFIKRNLFRVEISENEFQKKYTDKIKCEIEKIYGKGHLKYLYGEKKIKNTSYIKKNSIKLLDNKKMVRDILDISNQMGNSNLKIEGEDKYYIFYPKEIKI